jgi:hypothetical protein
MPDAPNLEAPDPANSPSTPDGGRSLMDGLDSAISQFHANKNQSPTPVETPSATPAAEEVKTDLAPDTDKPAEGLKDFDNPWEAEIKTEEEKAAEPKKDEVVPEPEFKSPAQKLKWGELRTKAEELDKLKPEVESLKTKIAELEKAEPKLPSEVEAELQELRNFRSAYAIEETPEYQQSVIAPMSEVKNTLDQVAEYAGVEVQALYDSLDITNPFQRASAIRKALVASENEVGEDAIQMAISATNEFHKNVVPKMQELKSNAAEIQKSLQSQKQVEQSRMSEKQQAELKKASTEIYGKLEASLKKIPGLFDDPKVGEAMKKASLANPSEKPMMAAYQAQVAAAMPYLIQTLNGLIQKNASLEKLAKSRSGAGAGPGEANRQGPVTRDGPDGGKSIMDALSSVGIR